MRKSVLASLVLAMTLSACSGARESRLNPFNWFGRSTSVVVPEPEESEVNTLIPGRRSILERRPEPPYAGTLVQEVTALHARQTPGGAVIEATGVFVALGGHDVRLVEQEDEDPATLTFEFRAVQPPAGTGIGSANTRTVTAAKVLTEQELFGVRIIRVVGQSNVRTVRR